MEKLSSTKSVPGDKKVRDHWARVSEERFQEELLDQWVKASIIYRLYHFSVSPIRYESISLSNKSRLSIFRIFASHRWEIVSQYSFKSCYFNIAYNLRGFPGGSDCKESAYNPGDWGLIPGSGRSPGWQPTPVFLPGRVPWTEELGKLQSRGLQRVGHD